MKNNPTAKLHYDPNVPCCSEPTQAELFPSLLKLESNIVNQGRLFNVLRVSQGVGFVEKKVTVNPKAWAECLRAPHFDSCLKLSMAKLAMESAV